MEIEIQSKNVNPLMNRTEVAFVISHKGEATPKRDLVRGELAEKLSVKKEQVVIDYMDSDFGIQRTKGYAKIYQTVDEIKAAESDYILKRNALPGKKKRKKEVKSEGSEGKPAEKKPAAEKPQ
ncbi:MAG: 30S ribosomal protein S24e [Candidatus Thermoplasmatota archaeon]